MSIDTDWEYKATHWESEAKRRIVEVNNLKTEILRLEEKLSPFKSGGDWGYIKALIVNGAPSPEIGKNLARKITEAQSSIDDIAAASGNLVPKTGTIVPVGAVDIDDILHDLDEARGFAAMSPAGRDNIAFALESLPDRFERMYRVGFADGEKHSQECADVLQAEKNDLIKTIERISDLVGSRADIIDTLTKALETISKGNTVVFDDDLQCDVEVSMDDGEMREIARSALMEVGTGREGT